MESFHYHVEDLDSYFFSFLDIFNIDVKGPLNGSTIKRHVKTWGETFEIEFDIVLHKEYEKLFECKSAIVEVTYSDQDEFDEEPSVWLCSFNELAFETSKKNGSHFARGKYVITPNVEHHVQFKQFRQNDYTNDLKRFVKIDDKIVLDRDIKNFTLVSVTVLVDDIIPFGTISNFKMSK